MYKCRVCGKRFKLLAKNRYEIIKKPVGIECLTKGTTYFNAFDCPRCGCQNIVGVVEKEQEDTEAIEKIRAEIKGSITEGNIYAENNGLFKALDIIDRHTGKEDSDG